MIVVVLKEGLGNQLFQYAAARSLSEKLNTGLKLDISSFKINKSRQYSLHHFNIGEKLFTRTEKAVAKLKALNSKIRGTIGLPGKSNRYMEKVFHFDPDFFQLPDNISIEGYWQSEKYFLPIEKIIRKEFVVKSIPDRVNTAVLHKIISVNAVSLHVRRGDYVTDKGTNALHGICSLSYYRKAIEYLAERVNEPYFFIFSDDMEWVKQNLDIKTFPVDYIDHNGRKDYEDLRLMYSCKHNILANSSFSWWGAWLNGNMGKIVIAPDKWVLGRYHNPDLLPGSWVRLEE